MDKKKILIIEDDATLVMLLQAFLDKKGFDLQVAYDGIDGLRLANEWCPDLILLDLRLPKMSGMGVIGSLRSPEGKLKYPIFVMTHVADQDYILDQYRISDLITKPVDCDKLFVKLQSFFGQKNISIEAASPNLAGDAAPAADKPAEKSEPAEKPEAKVENKEEIVQPQEEKAPKKDPVPPVTRKPVHFTKKLEPEDIETGPIPRRVMMIEEDQSLIDKVSALFKTAGYEIMDLRSGKEVMDRFAADMPGIVLANLFLCRVPDDVYALSDAIRSTGGCVYLYAVGMEKDYLRQLNMILKVIRTSDDRNATSVTLIESKEPELLFQRANDHVLNSEKKK